MTRRDMLWMSSAAGISTLLSKNNAGNSIITFEGRMRATDAVDHLVLGVADLDQGILWVEKMTGVNAVFGGVHPGAGTRNALLSLGGKQYLEIIAPDPEQRGATIRFGDLAKLPAPRLLTWAAATKDIGTVAQKARDAGVEVDGPRDGSRARPNGKVLRWKTMSIKTDIGGLIPFFIEWGAGVVHPAEDSPKGCQLSALTMEHPESAKVRDMLSKIGIDADVRQAAEARLKVVLKTPKGKVELS